MSNKHLEELLNNENVVNGLNMLAYAEGTLQAKDPYKVVFGGGIIGEDGNEAFQKKPFTYIDPKTGQKKTDYSTASFKYQFNKKTADDIKKRKNIDLFTDPSPKNQDLAALAKIEDAGALDYLKNGDYPTFLKKVNKTWASIEGSPYGQKTRKIDDIIYGVLGDGYQKKKIMK